MLNTVLSYVNNNNETCHILIDENYEECYVFNTSTLQGFKPYFVDGMEGIFEFINDEIEYIYDVDRGYLKIIHNYLMDENNSSHDNYKKFYNIFMEYYKEEKGSDEND